MSTSYRPLNKDTIKPSSNAPYLHTVLRSLRLNILKPFKDEQPKVAIFQNRTVAALHALIHIVPLGTAIALISLNLMTKHVGGVSSESITTLQFAAKFLEMLIQASLTTILLALIRNHLVVSQAPVAFGGLLAPYRMTSVSYLWSLEFWGAATSFGPWTSFKAVFCVFVPLFVALAAVVGPSSAILLIPRVGDYQKANRIVYIGPSETIYPRSISLVDHPSGGAVNITKPFFAEEDLNYTARSLYASNVRSGGLPVPDLSSPWGSRVLTTDLTPSQGDVSYSFASTATIPTQFIAQILSQYTQPGYTSMDFLPKSYQPYVYVYCRHSKSCSNESEYLEYNSPELNHTFLRTSFNDPSNPNRTVSQLYTDTNIDLANTTTLWATHPDHSIVLASIANLEIDPEASTCPFICAIDARWIVATTKLSSVYLYENEDYDTLLYGTNTSLLVDLTPEAMKRLTSIARDLLPSIHRKSSEPLHDPVLEFIAPAIALLMSVSSTVPVNMRWNTSDISSGSAFWSHQSGFNPNYTPIGNDWLRNGGKKYDDVDAYFNLNSVTNRSAIATMETQVFWTDYGYSSRDTTVKLSLAVMFVYVLIVLSYLVYSLYTGFAATSWDSIADLLVLALNSQRPDGFDHTSVGIQTLDVFRRPVRIRVVDDEACELVFSGQRQASGKSLRDVEVNRIY